MADTQRMEITVEDVVFLSDDRRFCVIEATGPRDEEFTVVGDLSDVSAGETLRIEGRFREHPRYGKRFQVESFVPITPTTTEGIARYLGSGLVPGVGPALAQRMVDKFGDQTFEVITTQSARLREVSGIGQSRASAIADAVRSRRQEAEVLSYLQGLGLGPAMARRVRHKYGAETIQVLRDDPYQLAGAIRGVGFRTADRIGQGLGHQRDDPRRAAGAVLHLVAQGADSGHTFMTRAQLLEGATALEVPSERVAPAIDELSGRGMLQLDGEAVYAPPLFQAEVSSARMLMALSEPRQLPTGARSAIEGAVKEGVSEAQALAVTTSFEHGLLVLTGGPGTGKTTTVRAVVAAHRSVEHRVMLCAPTGRAAKRLSEAAGIEARTIHRMLEFNPATGHFGRHTRAPLETDLVLVDEASMLDVQLAQRLLAALPPGCTLVLVGDVDQLSPISPGPLLRELIDSGTCPIVRLSEVFRQAQRSAIVRSAHAILGGGELSPTPTGERGDGDLFLIRSRSADTIRQRLTEGLDRMRSAYGLDPIRDAQVLTPMRRGPLGTEQLNEVLQAHLNPGARGAQGFRPGDKIMQLRNDYEREVFNGDLGEVRRIDAGVLFVDMGGKQVAYERDAQDALTLAYASTIHKVQGSEFPAVFVIVHSSHHILLTRALLYTAITRAKKLVVVIGDDRAIARAISNSSEAATNSRIRERLQAKATAGGS